MASEHCGVLCSQLTTFLLYSVERHDNHLATVDEGDRMFDGHQAAINLS